MTRATFRSRSRRLTLAATWFAMVSADAWAGPTEALADAVRRLAAADPTVREAAVVELAGLPPAQLNELADAAHALRPLSPAQYAGLRRAVVYVLARGTLSGLPTTGSGYLGIAPLGRDARFLNQAVGSDGAVVGEAMFGMVASRYLEAGDRIVAFTLDGRRQEIEQWSDLLLYVQPLRADTEITVHVLRGRASFSFKTRLDPRPAEAVNGPAAIDWLRQTADTAVESAEAEFDRRFATTTSD